MPQPSPQASPFIRRHIGPGPQETREMLTFLGFESLEAFADRVIGPDLKARPEDLPQISGVREEIALTELDELGRLNARLKPLIGEGFHGTLLPEVIRRNLLENPGWYTAYTPYQPEISQGRLELLFHFQTLIAELAGLDIANASLLDESTAAAEGLMMALRFHKGKRKSVWLSDGCHPATLEVVRSRLQALDLRSEVLSDKDLIHNLNDVNEKRAPAAILVSYPDSFGYLNDYRNLAERSKELDILLVASADPLALTLVRPPGHWGASIVTGNSQRFGQPIGLGGPHAAFLACETRLVRLMPGRIVGLSKDGHGNPAYRLALQTREQHIRREKATSNICTAQALPAMLASAYAIWHGREGLRAIAFRLADQRERLSTSLRELGCELLPGNSLDGLVCTLKERAEAVHKAAYKAGFRLRRIDGDRFALALDETVSEAELIRLVDALAGVVGKSGRLEPASDTPPKTAHALEQGGWLRRGEFLRQNIFWALHSETEMMRYLRRLVNKDIALDRSMIPLGSCTMKLNSAAEMAGISWRAFSRLHPYQPPEDWKGLAKVMSDLETWLAKLTGFDAVSLQPNAGSQGEFVGLSAIRAYHESRGESQRRVCLIPDSAHGTNPASATLAGFEVVHVGNDGSGDIDLEDLRNKTKEYGERLGAFMVTYPSTYGLFEAGIRQACQLVHEAGGQVYLDGANLNAQLMLAQPARYGADVMHMNLHKTFCIPHGGGGPGVGPIAVARHLVPFLPGDVKGLGGENRIGPQVSTAPFGSPLILTITWMYIRLMGSEGLRRASQTALLNANYMMARLKDSYPLLFSDKHGLCAHEFLIDLRSYEGTAGVDCNDVAKRLIDYGFHAPTLSFPVAGTLMIEPTESESKEELDRFCEAMLSIRKEIERIETGDWSRKDNPLVHAPHSLADFLRDDWPHSYSREHAALPGKSGGWQNRESKYWPPVGRIDQVYGDRHLVAKGENPKI